MSKIALLITGRAKPGKRAEVFELYMKHAAPRVSAEEGIELVTWSEDGQDADRYVIFEVLAANLYGKITQSDWFKEYGRAASELQAEPPSVQRLTPLFAKGIDVDAAPATAAI